MIVSSATYDLIIAGILFIVCSVAAVQNGVRLVQWLGKPGAEGRGDRLLGAVVGLGISVIGYFAIIRKFFL